MMALYRNNLKDREFGKKALQNFDAERATIAERQGASEHQNSEAKPTQPKTDSSGCFGIQWNKWRFVLVAACLLGGLSKSHAATWQQPPVQLNPTPGTAVGGGALDSDANGHAIALIQDGSAKTMLAYHYTNGSWGSPQTLFTEVTGLLLSQYALSMNPSGQAIAIWSDFNNPDSSSNIFSAFFDGTSWSTPTPNPLGSSIIAVFQNVSVSMNASGDAILTTLDDFQTISYATFSGGTWTPLLPITTIATSDFLPIPVAYSNVGTAVTAWFDTGIAVADNYIGGVWQGTVNLGSIAANTNPVVGIDSSGNALAAWSDPAGNIQFSYWDGSSWSPALNISTSPGNLPFVTFSMAPGGSAIAAWIDSSGNGLYSTFDGSTWGAPAVFSPGVDPFARASVSTDDAGNALILYVPNGTPDVEALLLPLGGTLGPVEIVIPPNISSIGVIASLSSNGVQFALVGVSDGEGAEILGTATLFVPPPPPPPPPSPSVLSISGSVCKNKYATQSELVKTIKWTPLQDPAVANYDLRRNGVLIATISSSGPFVYRDHKRCKKGADTYTLTAVNASGAAVSSATITL